MPDRRFCLLALSALVACARERTPERLAREYAQEPKSHHEELSAASRRWLAPDVFEAEPLPQVADAACKKVEERPARLRFLCANAAGQSRAVLLVREEQRWAVAETSRALRLLGKASEEIDAYAAAAHGAEIDPEEPRFHLPVARHLLGRVWSARLAYERLEEAQPFAERALALPDLAAKDRAQLLLRRARLELVAARGLPEAEAQRLVEQSARDAELAARLDPALRSPADDLAAERQRFARATDLAWLAAELRHERDRYQAAQAAGDAAVVERSGRRAHNLAAGLLGEGCGHLEEFQAELESAGPGSVALRVAAGADFTLTFATPAREPPASGVVDVASSLQRGACVIFAGRFDPCEKSATVPEGMRAPHFEVSIDDLRACPDPAALAAAPFRLAE